MRNEKLDISHLAAARVDDARLLPRIVDEALLARAMLLMQRPALLLLPLPVVLAELRVL